MQLKEVTASRYMPPWLPARAHHAFRDDRSLRTEEIELFALWLSQGMPKGEQNDLPEKPTFDSGWALGEPDLVVSLPEAYLHKSSNRDEWRNFVLPLGIAERRYVRTYDVRVDNPPAVHHAVIQLDSSGRARAADTKDPTPGFAGMQNGQVRLSGNSPNGPSLFRCPGLP